MTSQNSKFPTMVNPDPKVKILHEKHSSHYNPWWMITSFLITVTMSLFLYIVIDYNFLEFMTRDITLALLQLSGLPASITTFPFPFDSSPTWGQFGEAASNTPGITIAGTDYPAFWIVKACTGMQAGAILISLIYITPIPLSKKILDPDLSIENLNFKDRLRINHPYIYSFAHRTVVAVVFFIVLFIANSVRIWFHLWLVGAWGLPFSFAHDDLSKPIGFVGTLLFAWIITKCGIPIIDTFADWMDATWFGLKHTYNKIV